MDIFTIFSRLGFGKNAGKVYGALLRSKDPLHVSGISAKAGIGRPEIYRNLSKLIKHGYVKRLSGKRNYYAAESPRRLEHDFKKNLEEAGALAESMAKIRQKELPDQMRYFKGPRGIRAVFDDVVSHTPRGATFYRYTSERDLAAVNRYLSPAYRVRRDKKKLERLVISNPISGKQKKPRLERFIKFIPPEVSLFDHNIIQLIYGSRLAFIDLNTKEAFIIENKALAQFQAVIFNQLYKKL